MEDSEDDTLLLVHELRRGGYRVNHERVDTPEGMQQALKATQWDVIISDYSMPRFRAPEALEMVQETGSDAPFIVMSGKVGEEAAAETIKAGAYDFLTKDNLARLRSAVERGLEETREQRERKRTERELQRRDAVLEAVRFAAEQFLGETDSWEESVKLVLERLGEATGVSRVYVFENYTGEDGETWATQRYEWTAPGVSAQIDNPLLKAFPYREAGFCRWERTLGRGELVYGHTREFPESEQSELRVEDILSIVVVPIFVEGQWWGFVGFDECFVEREWPAAEMDALKAAASTLGAAIQRRRVEEELRGSEERYRAVIEQAAEGILLVDAEAKRILEANAAYQRLLDYTPEELEQMTLYDLVPYSREDMDCYVERVRGQGSYVSGERRHRRKDGSLVDVEVSASIISYGGREAMCVVVHDITERKRAEEGLRSSEAELRALFEAMIDVVLVYDSEGRYLKVAPSNPSLLYRPAEELLGKTLPEVLPKKQADSLLEAIGRSLGAAQTINHEYDLDIDGQQRWFEAVISPMKQDSVIVVARDITDRKHSEEALRQSERLYRTVMEQATENICLVDVETGHIVESNPAFQATLGYKEEELGWMTLYDIVAHDKQSVEQNIKRTLEQGRSFVGQRKYRRKDGTLVDVEASGSIILRNGRETLCVVAHDVTERARVQKLLEERVAALSRVASNVTLELSMREMLNALAESVVKASTAVACIVSLSEERNGALHPIGSFGLPEGSVSGLDAAWRAGAQSPTIRAFQTQEPVLVRNVRQFLLSNEPYRPVHHLVHEVPWDTVYIVPLISRGVALGTISFLYLPEEELEEDEKLFLGAVADQTAVAVENARLLVQARGKAVLEERQRLARDLHDSVSQALYGIALGTKTARRLLDQDPYRVGEPLEYILSLAQAGMAEMRALIFELRPESLEQEGLVTALEKQAAALKARHGIEVETIFCAEPEISLEVKETLYRVAQEALHNTVKHAHATNVEINMACDPGRITLKITDNGTGFDPQGDFPGHLGLRSMRERAEHLGGVLEIESSPGKGTRIHTQIPVQETSG